MVEYLPRSAWTDVPQPDTLAPLLRDDVRGDAQHWPGGTVDFAGKTQAQVARYLEGIRRYHTGTRGWSDIAYLTAVDPAGRVWELRGIEHRSAANGDTDPNCHYGATLWLVGPNEKPTEAQVTAYQTYRRDRWLRRYPDADQVKRHSDVRPEATACPGPYVGALVTSGTLNQPPEDDMPLTDAEIDKIADRVWDHSLTYLEKSAGAGVRLAATHMRLVDVASDVAAVQRATDNPAPVALTPEQVNALAAQITPAVVVALTDSVVGKVAAEVITQIRAHPLVPKP